MGRIAVTRSQFVNANCASFNGSSEYAYVDNPSWKADTAGAFCLRFRPDSLLSANGGRAILGYGNNSGTNDSALHWFQRRSPNTSNQNRVSNICRTTNGGTNNIVNGGTALAATTWYTLVVQGNGTTWGIYLNGAAETLTAQSGSNIGAWLGAISGTSHRLTFGTQWTSNAPNNYFPGRLDECIYVSGRVLTGAEVTEWHNGGSMMNPNRRSFRSVIASWWRFGDSRDTGATIFDEIGGNHLTTVNMTAGNYVSV